MQKKITQDEHEEAMLYLERLWDKQPQAEVAEFLRAAAKAHGPSGEMARRQFDWTDYKTFWPPRVLNAFREDRLVCFFGAGLSIPSGLPSWSDLLVNTLGVNAAFAEDRELEQDPLTLAELAAHQLGSDQLQNILRHSATSIDRPSATHVGAALLRLPIYLTTNYDRLFELCWPRVNPSRNLVTIANSADVARWAVEGQLKPNQETSFLIKLHGCADRPAEHLILTRSDYRRHYRDNSDFFEEIKRILLGYHVLFLGFSHTDPEVTRLVEDAIWEHEKRGAAGEGVPPEVGPSIYSLQYGMRSHTPEIFAAKGIVALRPSLPPVTSADARTAAVCSSLSDLLWAGKRYDGTDNLDLELSKAADAIVRPLKGALDRLGQCEAAAQEALKLRLDPTAEPPEWMKALVGDPTALATQGVYLVDADGEMVTCDVHRGLSREKRLAFGRFDQRPYFRQAKTFRRPFISDSLKSVYNRNSTFMLCHPIIGPREMFEGLLFSACQFGSWSAPVETAQEAWKKSYLFLLVDSNGVCLMPPKAEFLPAGREVPDEEAKANVGYVFDDLLSISRRDRLVTRVMENVVPIDQDDDVLPLAADLSFYTVIKELKDARWKLAISAPIKTANH